MLGMWCQDGMHVGSLHMLLISTGHGCVRLVKLAATCMLTAACLQAATDLLSRAQLHKVLPLGIAAQGASAHLPLLGRRVPRGQSRLLGRCRHRPQDGIAFVRLQLALLEGHHAREAARGVQAEGNLPAARACRRLLAACVGALRCCSDGHWCPVGACRCRCCWPSLLAALRLWVSSLLCWVPWHGRCYGRGGCLVGWVCCCSTSAQGGCQCRLACATAVLQVLGV